MTQLESLFNLIGGVKWKFFDTHKGLVSLVDDTWAIRLHGSITDDCVDDHEASCLIVDAAERKLFRRGYTIYRVYHSRRWYFTDGFSGYHKTKVAALIAACRHAKGGGK
jgi:hypothetical protein